MEDPELEVGSVLNQVEKEGKKLTKWELCRVVRELRKSKRFKLALEVYEWMNNRIERFKLSSSDTAIQLDLSAKIRGVSSAEDYFLRIPDTMKDNRIYGALLNAYVGAKEREKAESLMDKMRSKGYANHSLPFNVMMTLYMKFNEYDKVDQLVSEMKQKNIRLDIYSYNIWLSSFGSRASSEGMENVLKEIESGPTINPNWATFSTMASFYIKLGQIEKAEECLRNLETRITGRDNMPFHYLISLYSSLGKKEEVYRIWNLYKSKFPSIPNWGYHAVISALIRLGDIEGADNFYQEWLEIKVNYDPRIGNLLLGWYMHEEPFEKANQFFDEMIEVGGKPNSGSWEILGEGHTKEGRISEALLCFKEAVSLTEGFRRNWKPKPSNVSAFLELCEREGDMGSKDEFVGLLKQLGCFQDESFRSVLAGETSLEVGEGDEQVMVSDRRDTNDVAEETEGEQSEMLLSVTE